MELKKGYPGVVCCLNRAQTDALREECRLYELRCSEHCTRVYGELTEEVTKDEAYYSALRAKSYEKIKGEFCCLGIHVRYAHSFASVSVSAFCSMTTGL